MTKRGAVYDVRLRTLDGRPYKRSFRTRRAAEVFEAREIADRSRGAWIDPRRAETTFAAVANEWLTSNPAKRPSAFARDEGIVRVHLLPALGARRLGTIMPADVQTLVQVWTKSLKPRTVRRQFGVLRAIFRFAVERDYIGRSPCRGIKLPEVRNTARPVVTATDLERLAGELGPKHAAMAYLGAVLGLRWGECAGLRVGRIDFLRSTISITEQITRGPGGRHITGQPKSEAGRRTLAIPTPLAEMLTEHLARRGLTGAHRPTHSCSETFTTSVGVGVSGCRPSREPASTASRSTISGAPTRPRSLLSTSTSRRHRPVSATPIRA